MLMPDPDWIDHRLEVTGPDKARQEFMMAAEGPGFVDWTWPSSEERDYWSAITLRGGAPSPTAADRLAKRYADYLWWAIADARTDADCGYTIAPLDLNALQPIPQKILRAGWRVAGHDWCWQHWGTRFPLRKVTFKVEHRRQRDKDGIDVVAVYEFMSGDWSPWRALRAWRRKWPTLTLNLQPRYGVAAEALYGQTGKAA